MIVEKNLSIKAIFEFTGHHLYWLAAWMITVVAVYDITKWRFLAIPWLPLSLVGTAVAFYVGFKNSQSYSRLLEARIIWGGFVNDSRKFATMVRNFRSDSPNALINQEIRKKMIHRHIAYLYQLRRQTLEPAPWEHISQNGLVGYYNKKRRDKNLRHYKKELDEVAATRYLSEDEERDLQGSVNKATQLLNKQTAALQQLYTDNSINSVQQIQIQEMINGFIDDQGRAERVKRFPFPRKYASFSFIFVSIFIFLLPFGIIGEFTKLGEAYVWLSVPVGVIIGWVYVAMELIGDYSENPFQGLHNDIPTLSINRAIEIDILQIMGEKEIPQPIQAKDGILL